MSASKTALLASMNSYYKKCGFLFGVFVVCGVICPLFWFLGLWSWWSEDTLTLFFIKAGMVCSALSWVGFLGAFKLGEKASKIQRFLESMEEN